MSNIDTLVKGIGEFDIKLSQDQQAKFSLFKELIQVWNEKINLTAITEDKEMDIKHFLDSASIFETGKILPGKSIIDIGTGGGFPGIPIKIIESDTDVVLFDSLKKRLKVLDDIIEKLDLKGIKTVHGRAEEASRTDEFREVFDLATSRAVASLPTLCEYCLPFVKVGGYFIAMKGPDLEEELKSSENAIKKLGGEVEDLISVELPSSDIVHNLLIIKKINHTPTKYPRGGGKPKKKPL